MAYFKYFPDTPYNLSNEKDNSKYHVITDLLVRFRKTLGLTNAAFFEQYFIRDSDRPDTVSHMFYGDSELHWLVLYANYMNNPYYDWPLDYMDLQKYIIKKYGSSNVNDIHHYEDSEGNWVDQYPQGLGSTGYYQDQSGQGYTPITNFLYEEQLNDKKRPIDIIRNEYVPDIIREFKKYVIE